jgi:hypothetical protein
VRTRVYVLLYLMFDISNHVTIFLMFHEIFITEGEIGTPPMQILLDGTDIGDESIFSRLLIFYTLYIFSFSTANNTNFKLHLK